jgi:hypothetical protein
VLAGGFKGEDGCGATICLPLPPSGAGSEAERAGWSLIAEECAVMLPAMMVSSNQDRTQLLFKAGKAPRESWRLKQVTKAVAQTCIWDAASEDRSWSHGDYRFMILEIESDFGAAFVQLWSEPHDAVVFEVSSGQFAPISSRSVNPQRRAAILRKLGFTLRRKRPSNWRRELNIRDATECQAVGVEMLRILREVFQFQSDLNLTVRLLQGSLLTLEKVLYATRIDRVVQMLRASGAVMVTVSEEDHWLQAKSEHGLAFRASLSWPVTTSESGTFRLLDLAAEFRCEAPDLPAIRAELRQDSTVMFSVEECAQGLRLLARQDVFGGVTPRMVKEFAREFLAIGERISARYESLI